MTHVTMKHVELRGLESLGLVGPDKTARRLHLMTPAEFTAWRDAGDAALQDWIAANAFTGKSGSALVLTKSLFGNTAGGGPAMDAIGIIGNIPIWDAAAIARALPAGTWQLDLRTDNPAAGAPIDPADFALGWALAQYRFDAFRGGDSDTLPGRRLVLPETGDDAAQLSGVARGVSFCRDLINMPPNHMTPAGLEAAARHLADEHGATITVTSGTALETDFPAIHTVGRAAEIAPRLIDMRWGKAGPKITLVGKGITFDSGGLDLKPSKAMELMKKDMGGAATVLGLASAIMESRLQLQLRVLVPAAENAVSERAMRPLDVIDTRAGIAVEVGNTDAEGRLVLADALSLALEDTPDFMIDFATLTGAARVALGTELPALFCNQDATADGILAASNAADDPLWRLPLFDPYERHLDGGHVALSSTGASGYGGAITAALFLRRFAGKSTNWAHVDVMAWNLGSRAGRPKGGEAMGLRALFHYICGLA